MICEMCGAEHDGKYGSGRFCCVTCSRKYSSTVSKDVKNEKIRNTFSLKPNYSIRNGVVVYHKPKGKRKCIGCGKDITFRGNTGYCRNCYSHLPLSEQRKKKQSNTMKERGYKRWHVHRNEIPITEKIVIDFLETCGIEYEHDKSIPMFGTHYVLDFFFNVGGKLIDIEIDGYQHKQKERSEHDKLRDSRLKECGYIVHRISVARTDSKNNYSSIVDSIKDVLILYGILK